MQYIYSLFLRLYIYIYNTIIKKNNIDYVQKDRIRPKNIGLLNEPDVKWKSKDEQEFRILNNITVLMKNEC